MFKIFLIKANQVKPTIVNIFGELVENVYLEYYAFSHCTIEYNHRYVFSRLNSLSFSENEFEIDCGNTIVIEFKNGSLIYFNGNTSGGSIGIYLEKHEKVDVLPERIEF